MVRSGRDNRDCPTLQRCASDDYRRAEPNRLAPAGRPLRDDTASRGRLAAATTAAPGARQREV